MAGGQQVVLIDGLSETEQVLKAVFEPKGTRIERIHNLHAGTIAKADSQPNVVIFHEAENRPARPVDDFFTSVPRVVISSGTRAEISQSTDSETMYLQKPFQYPELIRAVETLLEQSC